LKDADDIKEYLNTLINYLPSASEKLARAKSMVMGDIFFKEFFNIQDRELRKNLVKEFVEKTNFNYSAGDRPAMFTGPFGSLFGLFKNWTVNYASWLATYANEARYGNFKPLMHAAAMPMAFGGVAAAPFSGELDYVSKLMTDKSLMQHIYQGTDLDAPGGMSDVLAFGIPAFMGFSLQNQLASPGANFESDLAYLTGLAHMNRINAAFKAFGSAIDAWQATDQNPLRDLRTRELMMRAFLPKAFYSAAQAAKDDAIISLNNGYPIINESVTALERMGMAGALSPTRVARAQTVARELFDERDKRLALQKKLAQQWADATEVKDNGALREVVVDSYIHGLDMDSVIRGGKAILGLKQKDLIEAQFSPKALKGWMADGNF
jgi:hypothetical protein